jgi:hypothetical protein
MEKVYPYKRKRWKIGVTIDEKLDRLTIRIRRRMEREIKPKRDWTLWKFWPPPNRRKRQTTS